ncbi:MAG: YHYH protein [Myxococcota bacterium]
MRSVWLCCVVLATTSVACGGGDSDPSAETADETNGSGSSSNVNENDNASSNSNANNDNANSNDTNSNTNVTCDAGFSGNPCTNINECAEGADNCSMNATCTDNAGSFSCACNPPFSGDGIMCTNPCDPTPCLNGASCASNAGAAVCSCLPGYDGPVCGLNVDDCSPNPCRNSGTCIDGVDSYTCMCPLGFSGTNCETFVADCSDNPCVNGTCNDEAVGYSCTCADGFTGDNCDVNIDDCADDPCLNGGLCTDGIDTFTCTCQDGFSGDTCELDVCTPNPCTNSGTCQRDSDGFTCACPNGFSGDQCENDACGVNPCENGGTCVGAMGGGYECDCPVGYSGTDCELWAGASNVAFCENLWGDLLSQYPDAGALDTCDDTDQELAIARSLMNVNGLIIDNDDVDMRPCISVRCDDTYAYVATNALPHYDYVPLTPNDLIEFEYIYRFPITPTPLDSASAPDADDATSLTGCIDGLNQYLDDPDTGTNSEPGGSCATGNAPRYNVVNAGTADEMFMQQLQCLGTTGFMINGVPTFGPNEGPNPDPYGNPLYFFPDTGTEAYTGAAALDLCGGHTGTSMHYHGANEACFELTDENLPANPYAEASPLFDFAGGLVDDCTTPSPIIGWAVDGYPIRGPCVCETRDVDGECTSVKRVRSTWVYSGLSDWIGQPGADDDTAGALANEGISCTNDATCCGMGSVAGCDLRCVPVVTDDASSAGGTEVSKRCALLDYSWCVNKYVNRSAQDMSGTNYVYLDRCNGIEGADGYAYHATNSFPMFVGCYRGAAPTQGTTEGGGGGDPGGGGPTSCTTNADCVGACDPSATGACECASSPMGDICASTCTGAGDCAAGEICGMGYCRPDM